MNITWNSKESGKKTGEQKMVRCHSGAFATSVGQKRLTEEKGRGKIFPNKVPTISYTSAVSESSDLEGKKTKNGLPIEVLEPCNDHPLPTRIIKLREMMLSCSSCGNTHTESHTHTHSLTLSYSYKEM